MHQLQNWRKGFVGIAGLCCCFFMVLSAFGEASALSVKRIVAISSPASNATVSGSISIAAKAGSSVSWVNFYIDHAWIAASPPYSALWNSTTVSNGQHVISVNAYASNGTLLATSSTNVRVTNKSSNANPTPTPAPTSTPAAASTPVPTPGATPISTGNAYYIDSDQTGYNGSSAPSPGSACALADNGPGTSEESPKCTMSSVSAMQSSLTADSQVLFKRGDVWSEELTITNMKGTSGHPIVLSAYGSGASPIIDGGSKRNTCVNALNTTAKYITIDGFECRNSTEYGMTFQTSGGQMPGIIVENSYIHNTGPGTYAGGSGAFDDGNYRNQLDFEDFGAGTGADGVSFLNNTVNNCGGHNCLEVHYDAGGPIVHGNVVGPGCLHNCIDLKGAVGAAVDQNIATTGTKTGTQGCIYLENTYTANSTVLVTRNVCYGSAVGLQIDTGGSCVKHQHCLQTVTAYNNTMVAPADAANPVIVGGSGAPADITVTWENNITDGGTVDVNPAVSWTDDYNDDGGHQGQYSTNVTPGSHDLANVDPLYISFQGNNYQLQADSPVSHAGLPGLDNDMTSLGAYPAP